MNKTFNKEAFDLNKAKEILTTLGTAGAVGAGIAGIGALVDYSKSKMREIRLPQYFQAMLDKHPDIKMMYESDPQKKEEIEDLFKLLEDFAPRLVENSLASGTFIRQLAKYGDMAGSTDHIQALSSINKNIADANKGKTDWGGSLINKLFNFGYNQSNDSSGKNSDNISLK